MFRAMRRAKQALGLDACDRLLEQERRGGLAVNGDDGFPYAVPINFLFDPASRSIYFHSALSGHKIEAMKRNNKVCFTVWNRGIQQEGDWSYFVDSVVAFGRASIVEDEIERIQRTKQFGLKYYPNEAEVDHEIEKALDRMLLIRIDIDHLTGKHVHER